MKIFTAVMIITLLLVACANQSQSTRRLDVKEPAQGTTLRHRYLCESGQTIMVSYLSTHSAAVAYRDTQYTMNIAVSGSGARYVAEEYEWWVKGSGTGAKGTLFSRLKNGTTGDAIETCTAL